MTENHYKKAVVGLLKMDGIDLSETAKYVLARLLLAYGNRSSAYRTAELATLMSLSHTSTVGALRELCRVRPASPFKHGYLIREPVYADNAWRQTRAGRPRIAYRVAEDFLAGLWAGKDGIDGEFQQEIVSGLLLAAGKSQWAKLEQGNTGGMAASADAPGIVTRRLRYLLAVLWSLADETGVVWGVSLDAIVRLAGIPKAKVVSALLALQKKGLILRRVPAHEGGTLFRPFPGAFFLNPAHLLIRCAVGGLSAQRHLVKGGDEVAHILVGSMFHDVHDIEDMRNVVQTGHRKLLGKYAGNPGLAENELRFKKNNLFLPAWIALERMQGKAAASAQFSELNIFGRERAIEALLKANTPERKFYSDVVLHFAGKLLTRNVAEVANSDTFCDEKILDDIDSTISDMVDERFLPVRRMITLWLYGEALILAKVLFYRMLPLLSFQQDTENGQEKKAAIGGREFYCFCSGPGGLIEMLYWLPVGEAVK